MTANNYKGTGAVFMRSFIRATNPAIEERVLAKLSPEDADRYLKTLEFDWIPIGSITRIFEAAAPLLFPGHHEGLRLIGRAMAYDHLRGIYRIILRVTTVPFVISQTARLWSTYHRRGSARLERNEPQLVHFVVSDYPDLPERFRECLCGYIHGVMELCGARDIRIAKSNDNPSAWLWRVSWK